MNEEVYTKGKDEVIEVIYHEDEISLSPLPYIVVEKNKRYGFLGLKKAKENLYADVYDFVVDETLYTRQQFKDEFGIDPENDTRPRINYFVTVKRKSGREITKKFDSEELAKNWIKENYPEYTRVE